MLRLADLCVGERARILNLRGCCREYRQRLQVMGLTRGAEFTLVRVAPFGDPVEIRVRGGSVCLRKDEACGLLIERVGV